MHHTLIALASVLLSGGESWLSDGLTDAPQRAREIQITPTEPSTLTLALIGIGTIAVYFLATGRWRRRDAAPQIGRSNKKFELAPTFDRAEDKPSRGAA